MMFGLTKREQRWKADQQVAELLVSVGIAAIQAKKEIAIAEMQANNNAELRAEIASLREQLAKLAPATQEDDHG